MLLRRLALLSAGLGLVMSVGLLFSQPAPQEEDNGIFDQSKVESKDENGPEGIEEKARGPVHEAFANPSNSTAPKAQPVVPNAPPPIVEELPPDQKPAGDNVQWLSGYWHYDEDEKDFLWVSGLWQEEQQGRPVPHGPGRSAASRSCR